MLVAYEQIMELGRLENNMDETRQMQHFGEYVDKTEMANDAWVVPRCEHEISIGKQQGDDTKHRVKAEQVY